MLYGTILTSENLILTVIFLIAVVLRIKSFSVRSNDRPGYKVLYAMVDLSMFGFFSMVLLQNYTYYFQERLTVSTGIFIEGNMKYLFALCGVILSLNYRIFKHMPAFCIRLENFFTKY